MALDNFLPRGSLAATQMTEAADAADFNDLQWDIRERASGSKPSVTLWDEVAPRIRRAGSDPADDSADV